MESFGATAFSGRVIASVPLTRESVTPSSSRLASSCTSAVDLSVPSSCRSVVGADRAATLPASNSLILSLIHIFNEELLLQRVLNTAKTDDERLYFLGFALENMRACLLYTSRCV